jgi:DNA-binding MarR family transcriptional regulator
MSANSAIEKIVQLASGANNLTLAHWIILVYLARAELCKQGDLMSGTGIAVGYLTRLLDDLEAKGMIRRHRSSEDRRQILLALTDSGKSAALALLGSLRLWAGTNETESSGHSKT